LARVERTVRISSPLEKVWSFVNSTERFSQFMEGIKEFSASDRIAKVGTTGHMTLMVGDQELKIESKCTECVENVKLVFKVTEVHGAAGPKRMDIEWRLKPVETGTELTMIYDYELPYSIFGKILDKVKVSKDTEKTMDKTLQNLRNQIET